MRHRILIFGTVVIGMCVVAAPSPANAGVTGSAFSPFGKIWDCTDPRELLGSCLRPQSKTPNIYKTSPYYGHLKAYNQRTSKIRTKLEKPPRTIRDKRVK